MNSGDQGTPRETKNMTDNLQIFRQTYGTAYGKIQSDAELDGQIKTAFDDHLRNCSTGADVVSCAEDFFRAHQCLGSTVGLEEAEVLGRIQLERDFVEMLLAWGVVDKPEIGEQFVSWLTSTPKHERLQVGAQFAGTHVDASVPALGVSEPGFSYRSFLRD
jgi:hypothetical protein